MKSVELKHRVIIQIPVEVKDSFGSVNIEWQEFCTVWAAIYPISGKEYFSSKEINSEITTKVKIRYQSGIKPSMRISYNERIFEILSVINPKEANRELQLMCKEVI